jgi:hypothetical protein
MPAEVAQASPTRSAISACPCLRGRQRRHRRTSGARRGVRPRELPQTGGVNIVGAFNVLSEAAQRVAEAA